MNIWAEHLWYEYVHANDLKSIVGKMLFIGFWVSWTNEELTAPLAFPCKGHNPQCSLMQGDMLLLYVSCCMGCIQLHHSLFPYQVLWHVIRGGTLVLQCYFQSLYLGASHTLS